MKLIVEIKPVGNQSPKNPKEYLEKITKKLYFTFQPELKGTIDETDFQASCFIKTHASYNPVHKAMLTTFHSTRNNDYFALCAVLAKIINTEANKNILEFGVEANQDEIVNTYINVKDNNEGYLAIQKLHDWLEKHDLDSLVIGFGC